MTQSNSSLIKQARRLPATRILGVVIIAAVVYVGLRGLSPVSPAQLIERARTQRERGNPAEAERLALRALELEPQMDEAALVAGECAAMQSSWSRALEHFDRIDSSHQRTRLAARLKVADILDHHLHRLSQAEQAYRAALNLDPASQEANKGLAVLLCRCARTREAVPFILRLIQANDRTELVLMLARNDMTSGDASSLRQAVAADATDPNPLTGLAWHVMQSEQFAEAERLLHSALRLDSKHVPALILLGRLYVMVSRRSDFRDWARSLPPAADEMADIWLIRGQMAEETGDTSGAVRSYWETLRLSPESKQAAFRLDHCLSKIGDDGHSKVLRDRIEAMQALEEMQNRVLFSADRKRPELLLSLAQAYEASGRLWEAYGWCQRAVTVGTPSNELFALIARLKQRLQDEPRQLVTDSANVVKTLDFSHYPSPEFLPPSSRALFESTEASGSPVFRDDAARCGVHFQYFNGVKGPPTHRMFEFTGGGVGVLDFDLDSSADIFFTQGCNWPRWGSDTSGGDRLFRNQGGIQFEDVSVHAQISEHGFGQGIAIGDFNSDGFPDVYVANIGQNQLWQNQGDGTFLDVTVTAAVKADDWTTSTVLVDLTGDGLPDIYDVNYAADSGVFDRVCHYPDGSPGLCKPSDFHGQADRLWKNLGDGRFQDVTKELLGEVPLGMGLGVAAWDADGRGQLSLFVANDTTPCFFFQPQSVKDDDVQLRDRAIDAGLAFNSWGKATGCMGVALGYVDQGPRMGMVITNFYGESNTFFINTAPGLFEDESRQRGLDGLSLNMLGFGTQFLDVDHDGRLELFVSNGHVDDLTRYNRPNRMPAQLFQFDRQGRFVELPQERLGDYFEQKWLGRAAARLDWNRDGRDDLVVGHLHDPVALLTNLTPSSYSHLSLRLVGVESNRDAIGTRVEVRIGAQRVFHQLTAGDGYQCSNERRLCIGAGQATKIDELIVRWPSGRVQRFADLVLPTELLIRENGDPVVGHSF